jgi:hypothetical protein
VVLYGCETLSLTLREEHRLGVFENRVLRMIFGLKRDEVTGEWRMGCLKTVLRRIFGLKRDEVTGEWRKLHNEELHDLYSLSSIIRIIKARRMRRAKHVARMGKRGMLIGCWWESQREGGH